MLEGKTCHITQNEVLNAYRMVKANKGAGGVDGIDFDEFDKDWKNRLYKLWNRMASGSYYPRAVRGVEIPKKNGKMRLLGIPTIEDRVAQMVLRNHIEPYVEPIFQEDSYGYRPNKSALDAVGKARERCFKMKWVIVFDVVGLFDNISHDRLMELVKRYTNEPWVRLYIERCLKAPVQMPDGKIVERRAGTPQGGVISPVLANLFMHYVFDTWMVRKFPSCPWERYADDGVIHCVTRKQAEFVLDLLKERAQSWGLEIHPQKSKIIYCMRNNEHIEGEETIFEFLGYEFRPRLLKSKTGGFFMGFSPAVSPDAGKRFREKIRTKIQEVHTTDIVLLSQALNPIIRGWWNYVSAYAQNEAVHQGVNYINLRLVRWVKRTRKKAKRSMAKAMHLLSVISKSSPELFYHWKIGYMPTF